MKWIPCSEKLPEEGTIVLACISNLYGSRHTFGKLVVKHDIDLATCVNGRWKLYRRDLIPCFRNLLSHDTVEAWMELPKSYIEDEEE